MNEGLAFVQNIVERRSGKLKVGKEAELTDCK